MCLHSTTVDSYSSIKAQQARIDNKLQILFFEVLWVLFTNILHPQNFPVQLLCAYMYMNLTLDYCLVRLCGKDFKQRW